MTADRLSRKNAPSERSKPAGAIGGRSAAGPHRTESVTGLDGPTVVISRADGPTASIAAVPQLTPVFVDPSGRRHSRLRWLAYTLGLVGLIYAGLVGVSFAGGIVAARGAALRRRGRAARAVAVAVLVAVAVARGDHRRSRRHRCRAAERRLPYAGGGRTRRRPGHPVRDALHRHPLAVSDRHPFAEPQPGHRVDVTPADPPRPGGHDAPPAGADRRAAGPARARCPARSMAEPTLRAGRRRLVGSARRRRAVPPPSWILLSTVLALLAGVLLVEAYANASFAPDRRQSTDGQREVPTSVVTGGPIISTSSETVRSYRLPAAHHRADLRRRPRPGLDPRGAAGAGRPPGQGHVLRGRLAGRPAPRSWPAELADGGHELGVHTFTHPDLDRAAAVAARPGVRPDPARHRPRHRRCGPRWSGSRTPRTPSAIDDRDWPLVTDGRRARLPDVPQRHRQPGLAAARASTGSSQNATPAGDAGARHPLHDAGGDRSQTVAALDRFIPMMKAAGLPVRHRRPRAEPRLRRPPAVGHRVDAAVPGHRRRPVARSDADLGGAGRRRHADRVRSGSSWSSAC